MMRTVCKGWNAGSVHREEIVLHDDGRGGQDSDGICADCVYVFRVTHGLDTPPACGCTEHVCVPPAVQTVRYPIGGGVWLCAACYIHGHMAFHIPTAPESPGAAGPTGRT